MLTACEQDQDRYVLILLASCQLVSFIIRIYNDARSPERQILAGDITMITIQAHHILHKPVFLKYLKCGL